LFAALALFAAWRLLRPQPDDPSADGSRPLRGRALAIALATGFAIGVLTAVLGVGGGFLLVPAMLYILGMSGNVVVGTSLYQILFVTMVTTMTHALTTKSVDIVLAALLLLGSVMGAQFGTQIALKARPEYLRLALAALVLLIALRMLYGLGVQPDEIYTVAPL
jgi:uncharacterized membrane protein YfcA